MSLYIQAFPSGPFETNAYVVACAKTGEAAVVDPAPGSTEKICAALEAAGWKVKQILLTHSHWDHIADVSALKKRYPAPVLVHPLDAPNLERPGADRLPCWIAIEGVKPDGWLEEGGLVKIGEHAFSVIHTPGHTPGSLCLYCPQEGVLLSGDTLFRGSIGNLSFPTSQPDRMWPSLDKLARLPPETVVYPGHGPSTTIAAESWLPRARELFDR